MSVEALWTVEFQSVDGWMNGGVIVLESGRAFGGDSQFYYTGKYRVKSDAIYGSLRIDHYHGDDMTAFGIKAKLVEVTVAAELNATGNFMGFVRAHDGSTIGFRMTRRRELP